MSTERSNWMVMPFVMRAGDCVRQPPRIRHHVLESSDGFEVIEIGSTARHMTYLDHALEPPSGRHLPERITTGKDSFSTRRKRPSGTHVPTWHSRTDRNRLRAIGFGRRAGLRGQPA